MKKQKTSKRNWITQEKNSAIKTKPKRLSQKQRDQDKWSKWPLKKPARGRQQRGPKQSNIKAEVTEAMSFIQQKLSTLQNYNEQSKYQLNKDTTKMGAW